MCSLESVLIWTLVAPVLRAGWVLKSVRRLVVLSLVRPFLGPLVAVKLFLRRQRRTLLRLLVAAHILFAPGPPQRVNVGLQLETLIAGHIGPSGEFPHDRNQAVRVQGRIVLLRLAHRPQFPVGHLFALANFKHEHFFRHFGKPRLLASDANFGVVGLGINKVAHVLVEVHFRQVFGKYVHIGFKGKPNVNGFFMREKFGQYLVEDW